MDTAPPVTEILTEAHIEAARRVHDAEHDRRHSYHERRGGLAPGEHWPTLCQNSCGDVADQLAETFAGEGWKVVDGRYTGPGSRRSDREHAWNLLPDGTIVDATADQYGLEWLQVIPPTDPRARHYHPDPPVEELLAL